MCLHGNDNTSEETAEPVMPECIFQMHVAPKTKQPRKGRSPCHCPAGCNNGLSPYPHRWEPRSHPLPSPPLLQQSTVTPDKKTPEWPTPPLPPYDGFHHSSDPPPPSAHPPRPSRIAIQEPHSDRFKQLNSKNPKINPNPNVNPNFNPNPSWRTTMSQFYMNSREANFNISLPLSLPFPCTRTSGTLNLGPHTPPQFTYLPLLPPNATNLPPLPIHTVLVLSRGALNSNPTTPAKNLNRIDPNPPQNPPLLPPHSMNPPPSQSYYGQDGPNSPRCGDPYATTEPNSRCYSKRRQLKP